MKLIINILAASIVAISFSSFAQDAGKTKKLKKVETPESKLTTKLLEIKGIYIGMPFDELSALYPKIAEHCGTTACAQYSWSSDFYKQNLKPMGVFLTEKMTIKPPLDNIGDNCIVYEVEVSFSEDKKINSVKFIYDESCYKEITNAFTRKYGSQISSINNKVTTGNGAEFIDTTVLWQSKDAILGNRRFSRTVDKSVLSLDGIDYLTEQKRKSNVKTDAKI